MGVKVDGEGPRGCYVHLWLWGVNSSACHFKFPCMVKQPVSNGLLIFNCYSIIRSEFSIWDLDFRIILASFSLIRKQLRAELIVIYKLLELDSNIKDVRPNIFKVNNKDTRTVSIDIIFLSLSLSLNSHTATFRTLIYCSYC